jgi:hypothetical protein
MDSGGFDMGTTILVWLIAILGIVMIASGVWGFVHLWNQRKRIRIPLRYYGMALGMICGGFGMFGIRQAIRILRVLLVVVLGAHY